MSEDARDMLRETITAADETHTERLLLLLATKGAELMEARREADDWQLSAELLREARDDARAEAQRLTQERDEARERLQVEQRDRAKDADHLLAKVSELRRLLGECVELVARTFYAIPDETMQRDIAAHVAKLRKEVERG